MKDEIIKQICLEFNISYISFISRSRRGSLPTARYVYYYLAHNNGLFTTNKELGESIGRDHSNPSVGITKVEELLGIDYNFRRRIKRIESNLEL